MQEERQVKYPCIYTYFKHNPKGIPNYMYCTMFEAEPLNCDDFWKLDASNLRADHTETRERIFIKRTKDKAYYLSSSDEKLVIYRSLYDDSIPYARPVGKFISKVPEGRESDNPTGQIYIFEEFR